MVQQVKTRWAKLTGLQKSLSVGALSGLVAGWAALMDVLPWFIFLPANVGLCMALAWASFKDGD